MGNESKKEKIGLFHLFQQRRFRYKNQFLINKTYKFNKKESNLLPGNELRISLKTPAWSSKGHVIKITASTFFSANPL